MYLQLEVYIFQVSSSLNSSYCYILQDQASFFIWLGSLSSPTDHDLVDRFLDQLNVRCVSMWHLDCLLVTLCFIPVISPCELVLLQSFLQLVFSDGILEELLFCMSTMNISFSQIDIHFDDSSAEILNKSLNSKPLQQIKVRIISQK